MVLIMGKIQQKWMIEVYKRNLFRKDKWFLLYKTNDFSRVLKDLEVRPDYKAKISNPTHYARLMELMARIS